MSNIHTDLSTVQVSVAPSPATSGTSLGVTDAQAALLPDVYPWWGLVRPVNAKPTRSNSEIVKVTAGSSSGGVTTYTIERAKGLPVTTARTIIIGDDISEVHTAQKQIDTEKDDGWMTAREIWTYASASTITVPSGAASKYRKGDFLKFTQHSAVKYAIVVDVADTLLTIAVNTDFVIENTSTYPITLNYYSHESNPIGFPEWFSVTPTISTTANAGTFSSDTKFKIRGGICSFKGRISYANALASGALTFSLPIALSLGALCIIGGAHYFDQGVADKQCFVSAASASTINFPLTDGNATYQGGAVTSATWNVNDWVDWVCSYPCF